MSQNRPVDQDGTPYRGLYIDRLVDRQISEMLGLVKGVVCDGVINDAEVVALKQWLTENPDVTVSYPGGILAERLLAVLADGVIEDDEREELKTLLFDLVGEPEDLTGTMNAPARLAFDHPPPTILFDGREYVFTGIFASGARAKCEREVTDRGGRCGRDVTQRTDFLVVGMMSSPAWVQSTHGRKIEHAIALKERGVGIHIVSEEHWLSALQIDAR